jgi:hypothetical protein
MSAAHRVPSVSVAMRRGRRYALTTEWVLAAPVEAIWDVLAAPEGWPQWWRYLESVALLQAGDAQGNGAVRRYTWSSPLRYRLTFDMTTTAWRRPCSIEGTASGDLCGAGRWRLRRSGETTRVCDEWTVTAGKRWMNLLAPLLAPLFVWSHDEVMRAGGRGLAHRLGVTLLASQSPPTR